MAAPTQRTDQQKQPKETPAKKDPKADATVAGSGDNRQAGDLDGNRSAGGGKSPGANSPEVD